MANKQKLIGEVYGVLLELKFKYDNFQNINIDLEDYLNLEMRGLINSATEWLAEDEEEKKLSL